MSPRRRARRLARTAVTAGCAFLPALLAVLVALLAPVPLVHAASNASPATAGHAIDRGLDLGLAPVALAPAGWARLAPTALRAAHRASETAPACDASRRLVSLRL